jgi:NAD(P)-dependent dehydrogenase (short-subunit alcohol dehydrogenase family)
VDNQAYWRQLDIVDPERLAQLPVTLIGAGGIGSATALALAKLGVGRLAVYDPDTVEEHNLPNQTYPSQVPGEDGTRQPTLGQAKVSVLTDFLVDMVGTYNPIVVTAEPRRHDGTGARGVVVSGVDSLEVRRELWEGLRTSFDVSLYLDARMGAEVAQVYALNPTRPDAARAYARSLEGEPYAAPCTARATIYGAFTVAALVARLVKGYVNGENLPFETILDMGSLALMKTSLTEYSKRL